MLAAPAAAKALTTRRLDFWLLGGASILVWVVMFSAERFAAGWAVDQHFGNLAVAALALSFLVNYPHFLLSYKLAYSRGRPFIVGHWWQLIAVPAALAAMFAAAYLLYDVPLDSVPVLPLARPRVGDLLFTASFHLMIVTLGWHYTKQVFGCMVVYAHFDGYPLTASQRRLLKWTLFSIWGMALVDFNLAGGWRWFGSFGYASFDLPDAAGPLSQLFVAAAIALLAHRVVHANYRALGRRPSPNMLVPFVALCVWWLPVTRQEEFFYLMAPLFHSLQYLAFVYKMEDTRLRGEQHRAAWATVIAIGVVIAGWLAFEFVPRTIDSELSTFDAWGVYFFVTAAMLFINIHHYFIDNVIWRFKDPEIRAYLLG
jgi:hypothetical protein